MKKSLALATLALLLTGCGSNLDANISGKGIKSPGTERLFTLMQTKDATHYKEAVSDGLKFVPTADGQSFYGFWTPTGFDPLTGCFVVALHGTDSFVSSSWNGSRASLEEYGCGYLGLQWWFGAGETTKDYYTPEQIHPILQAALKEQGIPGGNILLEGFSRGSANIYALKAIDAASDDPLFLMTIANAGGVISNYGPNKEIEEGEYGDLPFEGTHWVLFCGGKDPNPDQSGCPAMEKSKIWLESYGAIVDKLIEDPNAGHGGFHQNSKNATTAMGIYMKLLEE